MTRNNGVPLKVEHCEHTHETHRPKEAQIEGTIEQARDAEPQPGGCGWRLRVEGAEHGECAQALNAHPIRFARSKSESIVVQNRTLPHRGPPSR